MCTTVIDNTTQNSSDNFPSYPPDDRHTSDGVRCQTQVVSYSGRGPDDRSRFCLAS